MMASTARPGTTSQLRAGATTSRALYELCSVSLGYAARDRAAAAALASGDPSEIHRVAEALTESAIRQAVEEERR
jgi:hypothetical protein